MKIFSTSQIRSIDRLTIENEPIASVDLMERAAEAIYVWFVRSISPESKLLVFAGPGNNGGDGLALARMLIEVGYSVEVYTLASDSYSTDFQINLDRLIRQSVVNPKILKSESDFPKIDNDSVVIDSLFGTGLTRPLSGLSEKLVNHINSFGVKVVSVDIPSGLFGDENPFPSYNPIVKATVTLTLQFPKLSYMFAENSVYVGCPEILPIGLHPCAIESIDTPYRYVDYSIASSLLKSRETFSHKGSYGHCLIIAGSYGMMGASVLSSTACIKAGVGLVTAHAPKLGYQILQQSIPEVMVDIDEDDHCFSTLNSIAKYSAIGIGSGLGKDIKSVNGFRALLKDIGIPLLIDADALNILAENQDLLSIVPQGSILTPHPGEFDRLFGKASCGNSRLKLAMEKAQALGVVIILKGAYTQVVCPNGNVYFNSTGNPGMATGGSGDVLSGIVTSLLGQGYDSESASVLGVYLHGLAGDMASKKIGYNALTASDIIENIGVAFKLIEDKND